MSKKRKRLSRLTGEIIEIKGRKCIGCSACGITCAKVTKIAVLKLSEGSRKVAQPKKGTFSSTGCIYCGQCTLMCPTGAIDAQNNIDKVKTALAENKYTVATFAPATKVTLGEEFLLPIGTNVAGLVVTSARKLGFKKVFETDFGADMTVVEESKELQDRIEKKGVLPMFTSCCPAWIRWVDLFNRSIIPNLSTCKSPQQMMGATIKTYFAEINNINPKDIFVVSVKPCTAKKFEATLEGMGRDGYKDIDVVLTVREYAELLKQNGIDLVTLESQNPDKVMGEYTGGAIIFGASSGVMSAAIRNFAYNLGVKDIPLVDYSSFKNLEGFNGVRYGVFHVGDIKLNVAVVSGTANVKAFLESDRWKEFHFIEVMACPGGCINGGGTPKIEKKSNINENLCITCGTCIENCPVGAIDSGVGGYAKLNIEKCVGCTLCSNICRSNAINMNLYDKNTKELLKESYINIRTKGLSAIDKNLKFRVSAENVELQNMYKNYIGEVGGVKAEDLLHRSYK